MTNGTPANMDDLAAWNTARSLASDLYNCFKEREISFNEVVADWESLNFPSRDDCLMAVMNSKGETKTERINSVARWVRTWEEDDYEPLVHTAGYGRTRAMYQNAAPNQQSTHSD